MNSKGVVQMTVKLTTYDDIYTLFITNCNSESLMLPNTTEKQYDAIRNAVILYNNRMRDNIVCDDDIESVDRELNHDEQLVIAHFIRLTILKNTRTYKNSIFTTFTQEIGVRNINAQLSSLRDEIKDEEDTIDMLIFNMIDESIM